MTKLNLKKYEKILVSSFVFVEMFLYIISYVKNIQVTYFQYASILLCFIFSLFFLKKDNACSIISLALFFTICADFVLLFFAQQKVLGLLFFCFVQIVYFFYISMYEGKKGQKINLWARLFAIVLVELVIFFIFKNIFNFLAFLAIFYFVNLLFNLVFAFVNVNKNAFFAVGLLLFVFCDIFVGLMQMDMFFDVSSSAFFNFIYSIPFNIAWTFYIPSQVFIALGNVINKNEKKLK